LAKGFTSAGTSIWSGVTGVVSKPVEGAKKEGFGGFFKGIGKGATGLVAKTVSGTIDIVAKTSEGIDNSTKTQVQLSILVRIRRPRPFYEEIQLIRPFSHLHANWLNVLP
jgi:vacuolar protein sorting-associated protein 13A/C